MRALALLALTALLVAGCATPGTPDPDAPGDDDASAASWAERAVPYGDEHDHNDPAQHANLSTPNFEVIGWDPLLSPSQGDRSAGGYLCGGVGTTNEGRRVAVVNSYNTNVAFVLVDVTDAAKPVVMSEYTLTNGYAYDVAVTPDGLHVIIANDPDPPEPGALALAASAPTLRARDPCTGAWGPEQMLPLGPSTVMVGIADPKSPVFEDAVPAPVLGPHSVSTAEVDGKTFVVSSITNLAHQGSYYQIFTVGSSPLGPKLELQSVYQAPPPASDKAPIVNGHVDASIQKHPVTGQVLAYLADWDAGMIVLDITDPKVPKEVSTFSKFQGRGAYLTGEQSGNVHETYPLEGLWDGRHYVIAGQEVLGAPNPDQPTGSVWIIDDTDPANLELVGEWTLPVAVEWDGLTFSTHYVAVVNRTMFVTMYHGGVWAVDLSTKDKLADPPTIGAFVPDRVSPAPPADPGRDFGGQPSVLDVLPYEDGTLVVFDAASGVYTLRFDDSRPMTPPATWWSQQGGS